MKIIDGERYELWVASYKYERLCLVIEFIILFLPGVLKFSTQSGDPARTHGEVLVLT